jgi:hypothetical protein
MVRCSWGQCNRIGKYMREAAFRPVCSIGEKRPMVRWNVKDESATRVF